jgi:hypothetical protein
MSGRSSVASALEHGVAHVEPAFEHPAYGADDRLARLVLDDVAVRPCAEGPLGAEALAVARDDDHGQPRLHRLEVLDQVQSVHAGKGDLEDDYVRVELADRIDRLPGIRREPADGQVGFLIERQREGLAREGVRVDDQYLLHRGSRFASTGQEGSFHTCTPSASKNGIWLHPACRTFMRGAVRVSY